jgi:hypothetical protein
MLDVVAVVAAGGLLGSSAAGAALTFGFRHGVDWDHIAAIADLTDGQPNRRRSLVLATAYALGHAAVVLVLGAAAILFGESLPEPLDATMERVVGLTLVALGVYVVVMLVKHRGAARPKSRWMLLLRALSRARARLRPAAPVIVIEHDHEHAHEGDGIHHHDHGAGPLVPTSSASSAPPVATSHGHVHHHLAPMPADPFAPAGVRAAGAIGMLHGVGAETPTQVLVLATAANAGRAAGIGVLVCFVFGLLCANSLVAVAAAYGHLGATSNRWVSVALSVLTASFSLVVGGLLLFGQAGGLPSILGG